jgi:hypothetical protein
LRLFFLAIAVLSPSVVQSAEAALSLAPVPGPTDFRLGGAASLPALAPDLDDAEADQLPRLSLPRSPGNRALDLTEARIGPATVFVGEGIDDGRNAVQMGTFLSHGAARAGLSVTYLSRQEEVSRSEVFVDYALSDQLSMGLSGILKTGAEDEDPIPQLGVSAEYSTEGGAFLQGGFAAGASQYDPVVGLSVGLRF